MMRRALVLAAVVALTLTGCVTTYASPDDRSHARGAEVAEQIAKIEPQPSDVRVSGSYNGVRIRAYLGDMTLAETREFVDQSLEIVADSPLGTLPVAFTLTHASARDQSRPLQWLGYDPARADRYWAAVEVWMTVLADPGTEFDDEFRVQASGVYGEIVVHDDRDLDAYRAELVAVLEAAGYTDPALAVVLAD